MGGMTNLNCSNGQSFSGKTTEREAPLWARLQRAVEEYR